MAEKELSLVARDIPRVYPKKPFYCSDDCANHPHLRVIRHLSILFVGTNPTVAYVQGFHELFAVVYYCFYTESRRFEATGDGFSVILDRNHFEADVFWAASSLVKTLIRRTHFPGSVRKRLPFHILETLVV